MPTDRRDRPAFEAGPLAISALGACTCFGGMTMAAAAARAGLSRACALPDAIFAGGEADEARAVAGSPILGVTDGFEGAGRLARMSRLAAEELGAAAAWMHPRRVQGFVALPPLPEGSARRVAAQVAHGLGVSPDQVRAHASGHEGTALALREAVEAVSAGRCDHAVVGACDSWLDPLRLQAIAGAGRLKTGSDPVGLMPGEAAVFLLLERAQAAGRGREAPAAMLADVREQAEEGSYASERPPTGRALSLAALAALGSGGRGTLYVDINGEEHRAADWGVALARIQAARAVDGWTQEHPAASFGDTGAASPILATGLAARAFMRGYAVGERALVLASGDGPERLAILVERPRAAARGA